jgi:hypothetical protein
MNNSLLAQNSSLGGNAQIAANLEKALTVGYPNLPGNTGSALQTQALDPQVQNLAYQITDLALRQKLPVVNVNSRTSEYVELSKYGSGGAYSTLMPEVGTPNNNDGTVIPRFTALKNLGLQGAVSFDAIRMAGGSIVDPLNFVTRNTVMAMLQSEEELNFVGNSALSPLAYDGLIPQILARAPAQNVRDLRGQTLTQSEIERASSTVGAKPTFGTLTDLFLNTNNLGDLARQQIAQQRNIVGGDVNASPTILGIQPTHVRGTKGLIELHATPFLTDGGSPAPAPTGLPQYAPAAPTVTNVAAAAPANGQKSKFNTTSDVGDVSYVVVAVSAQGTSAPVYATPGQTVAVASGQVVNLTITPGAGALPEFFSVYRIKTNGGDLSLDSHKLILQVPNTVDGIPQNGSVTVSDTNAKLPGTYDAIALDFSPNMQNQVIVQGGSMARIPMGIVQTAYQFMVTHTMAIQLRAPTRAFLWQNVGLLGDLPLPV